MSYRVEVRPSVQRKILSWGLPDPVLVEVHLRLRDERLGCGHHLCDLHAERGCVLGGHHSVSEKRKLARDRRSHAGAPALLLAVGSLCPLIVLPPTPRLYAVGHCIH